MKIIKVCLISVAAILAGCESRGLDAVLNNADILAAGLTMNEASVIDQSRQAVAEMDSKNKVAGDGNKYSKRLNKLVKGLNSYDGLKLNYKVYLTDQLNAFATPDGSIRVFSGLMDAMTDDQLLAVIGHEIGHVKLKHSYSQMKQSFATAVGFRALASLGGNAAKLSTSQLGKLMNGYLNAQYSQSDELESDAFSVKFLKSRGKNPIAMRQAIEVFQEKFGNSGNFLSSHPSNPKRLEKIDEAIEKS